MGSFSSSLWEALRERGSLPSLLVEWCVLALVGLFSESLRKRAGSTLPSLLVLRIRLAWNCSAAEQDDEQLGVYRHKGLSAASALSPLVLFESCHELLTTELEIVVVGEGETMVLREGEG